MECSTKSLSFTVRRKTPELIAPAAPTPHEFKPLSDIDDQDIIRFHVPSLAIYGGTGAMHGKDPVKVIRDAIAKALVFYYPLAGRLREIGPRKLVVECTAEGVLFIEADADVTAQQLPPHPPFPNLDQLLFHVPDPGSDEIVDCPLMLFQVTRLKCGGFVLAFRFNHTISDAAGATQFMFAISELALGGEAPSIRPVWERHLLSSRNPPRVSVALPQYDHHGQSSPTNYTLPVETAMAERSFFFSNADISTLRRSLPPDSRRCSQFDLVAACIWRCRTMALFPNGGDEVRLLYAASIKHKVNPPLPRGYYGNALVAAVAVATAEELRSSPLHCITELVRKSKAQLTDEFVRSVMDLTAAEDRPNIRVDGSFLVSDLGHIHADELELGWGKPVYVGVAKACPDALPGFMSWIVTRKTGILVPMSLPPPAMELFARELKIMMQEIAAKTTISSITAAL